MKKNINIYIYAHQNKVVKTFTIKRKYKRKLMLFIKSISLLKAGPMFPLHSTSVS